VHREIEQAVRAIGLELDNFGWLEFDASGAAVRGRFPFGGCDFIELDRIGEIGPQAVPGKEDLIKADWYLISDGFC
jgi:hypothetical protein